MDEATFRQQALKGLAKMAVAMERMAEAVERLADAMEPLAEMFKEEVQDG